MSNDEPSQIDVKFETPEGYRILAQDEEVNIGDYFFRSSVWKRLENPARHLSTAKTWIFPIIRKIHAPPPIESPLKEGWRAVKPGLILKKEDIYYNSSTGKWMETASAGQYYNGMGEVYYRKYPHSETQK